MVKKTINLIFIALLAMSFLGCEKTLEKIGDGITGAVDDTKEMIDNGTE